MKEIEKIIEELKKFPIPIIPSPAEAQFLDDLRQDENLIGSIRKTLKKKD